MTTFTTYVPRDTARAYGAEALAIGERGAYTSPAGTAVSVAELIAAARAGTVSYPPGQALPAGDARRWETAVEVVNETTLSAARRLLDDGYPPVALNFAAATAPGGGFRDGARAQEEYLAWSSGLYACLRDDPMYSFHRSQTWTPFYSDYAIYTPRVPVFRADSGELLAQPYPVSVISSAAVNARKVPQADRPRIAAVMQARIERVLAVGHAHGHEAIVLGAWGCGAFANDPEQIAALFRSALAGPFAGVYRRVVFAIVDWSPEQGTIGPFARALAGGSIEQISH